MWSVKLEKLWQRVLVRCVEGLLVAALAVVVLLRYGNPQWHRRVHMFQGYTPEKGTAAEPPPDYTGVWTQWSRDGLRTEVEYHSGRPRRAAVYCDNGTIATETRFHDEERSTHTMWHYNGRKACEAHAVGGRLEGESCSWDGEGNLIARGTWRNGARYEGTFAETNLVLSGDGLVALGPAADPHSPVRTYREGRPWDGTFQRWDTESGRIVTSTYRGGVEVPAE